jgi:hypothetical protein
VAVEVAVARVVARAVVKAVTRVAAAARARVEGEGGGEGEIINTADAFMHASTASITPMPRLTPPPEAPRAWLRALSPACCTTTSH